MDPQQTDRETGAAPNNQPRQITAADATDFVTALTKQVITGIFTGAIHEPWRAHVRRLWYGALGGLFYTCLKNYFGAGVGVYGLLAMDPSSPKRGELMFGYIAAYVVSTVIGAGLAWLSGQRSGRLLFLIGMFGIQILLTIFPGLQSKSLADASLQGDGFEIIGPAYAGNEQRCVGDSAFSKGFKAAFGVRDYYDKYAVVVASGISLEEAQNKLKAISARDPSLTLHIGPRACDNDYYPIFASDYVWLSDAKTLLDQIKSSANISDAYLAPGPLKP